MTTPAEYHAKSRLEVNSLQNALARADYAFKAGNTAKAQIETHAAELGARRALYALDQEAVALGCVVPAPTPAPFDPASLKWGDVPIGGGGYITQIVCEQTSGLMGAGTDVQNCYLRRPGDTKWATVFRKDTMTPEDMVRNPKDYTHGLGCNRLALVDGTRAFAAINGWAFTIDIDPTIPLTEPGGIKCTRWNLDLKHLRTNQGVDRWWGPGISAHPANRDVCLLGTDGDGAFYTMDAGKTVKQIALPPASGGIGSVAGFERYLVWQGAEHSFAFVQGVGLHRSLTGPTGEFVLVPGSPKHAASLTGELDGPLWICGDGRIPNATFTGTVSGLSADAGLWRLDNGADSIAFVGNPLAKWNYYPFHMAVDPHDSNSILCWMEQLGGWSADRGQTWTYYSSSAKASVVAGGEAAWRVRNGLFMGGGMAFTPTPGEWLGGEGFGVVKGTDYKTNMLATDFSKGIEEFIVNHILVNPRTSQTFFNCWDRHVVRIDSLTDYVNQPIQPTGIRLSAALGMDVACDEDFYVVGGGSGTASHSWSADGKTLTPFGNIFPPKPGTTLNGGSAGDVAMGNKTDIVICQSNNWPAVETRGRFNPATGIPDRPEDWSIIELDGETRYGTISAFYVTRQSVSADKTRPGTMAMVVPLTWPAGVTPTSPGNSNPLGGLWVRGGTDAPWVQTYKGDLGEGDPADFWQCKLAYIPGRSGELLYSDYIGQGLATLAHFSDDGRKGTDIPDVTDVRAFGFGANPGQAYPAVLFRGFYKGEEAFWLTLDWFKTVQLVSDLYPNNYWSAGTPDIAGDPNVPGRWFISVGGKGAVVSRLVASA